MAIGAREEDLSLAEQLKDLRIPWYRCPIETSKLRELTKRSNPRGLFQAVGHLLLLSATASVTWVAFERRWWIVFAVGLFAHGTVFAFTGLATHELSHGTVFGTKRLNGFFLRIYSTLSWFNFHHYRLSHTYHHLYTLFVEGDGEVVLPKKPSLRILYLLQLFTINITGGWESHGVIPFVRRAFRMAAGRMPDEWTRRITAGHPSAHRRVVNWARFLLIFHGGVIVVSIVFRLWMLPVLVTFSFFIANWWRYFVGVPCYRLGALHRELASDMPRPRSLAGAWREMREIYRRQQTDPGYQFDTPLPETASPARERDEALATSLGDLEPDELA